MKNKLTAEEEAYLVEFLNRRSQPTSELADLVAGGTAFHTAHRTPTIPNTPNGYCCWGAI